MCTFGTPGAATRKREALSCIAARFIMAALLKRAKKETTNASYFKAAVTRFTLMEKLQSSRSKKRVTKLRCDCQRTPGSGPDVTIFFFR